MLHIGVDREGLILGGGDYPTGGVRKLASQDLLATGDHCCERVLLWSTLRVWFRKLGGWGTHGSGTSGGGGGGG